jgi:hypothetical protein
MRLHLHCVSNFEIMLIKFAMIVFFFFLKYDMINFEKTFSSSNVIYTYDMIFFFGFFEVCYD